MCHTTQRTVRHFPNTLYIQYNKYKGELSKREFHFLMGHHERNESLRGRHVN